MWKEKTKRMKKSHIAVDFIPNKNWTFGEIFKEAISSEKVEWTVDGYDNCGKRKGKLSELIRYVKYFAVAMRYFIIRKKIDTLLAYQQFYGIIFAFFCRLFHVKKECKLVIMTFIYKPKKGSMGKLYDKFIRYAVESIYIDKMICFSKSECEEYQRYFTINADKFAFMLLGKNAHGLEAKTNKDSYILSAGRSNRDYKFLIESFKDTKYKVKIVCDTIPAELKNKLPSNIQVLDNCFGRDYLEVLIHAKLVVLPLMNETVSSGQLVLLQAMEARVPVIVLGTKALNEYIEHGENGFYLIKDKNKLLNLTEKLYSDEDYYMYVADNGKNSYQEKHTIEALAKNVANVVREVNAKTFL